MITETKLFMRPLLMLSFLFINSSCDMLFPTEKSQLNPKLVEKVVRCNKFGTCLVVFEDGSQGLMTRPEVGIYGCKSLTERSFNECDAPGRDGERGSERGSDRLEKYEDFPEYPSKERK